MARPLVALQVSALAKALGICTWCVQTLKCKASPGCFVYSIGATADAFTLFERLEMQLEAHPGATDQVAVFHIRVCTSVDTRKVSWMEECCGTPWILPLQVPLNWLVHRATHTRGG